MPYGLCGLQSGGISCPAVVEHCVENNERVEASVKSEKMDSNLVPTTTENASKMPHRTSRLSNKERLLLRKQALKMKKRPVLAVGNFALIYNFQLALVVNIASSIFIWVTWP